MLLIKAFAAGVIVGGILAVVVAAGAIGYGLVVIGRGLLGAG